MRFFYSFVSLLIIAALLGGCSDIGKINGVPVSRIAGESTTPSYCQQNPAICIIGAAAAVGGTAAVIHQISKDNNKPVAVDSGNSSGGTF